MKKIASTLIIVAVLLAVGCSPKNATEAASPAGAADTLDKPVVYATIYPIYALVDAVGGDLIDLRPVVPFGVDPHDFEPSAKLIANLERANVIFYNGLAMEPWLDRMLDHFVDNGVTLINLSEVIEPIAFSGHDCDADRQEKCTEGHDVDREEKCAEGHDVDHEEKCAEGHDADREEKCTEGHNAAHAADHAANRGHEGHQHGNFDPHIWQDPLNAMAMVDTIFTALNENCPPQNETQLLVNYKATKQKLTALDESYRAALDGLARREIVVGHAAFGYLCHRYALQQIAVAGLSTHDEPSAALIAQIADLSKKHGIKVVFYDELGSDKLARVIADEIGVALKPLNPIGVITTEQLESGEDYFTLMEQNLQAIQAALTN